MAKHYTEGRRWSHISNAWILLESWSDREEIAMLRACVAELETALRDILRENILTPEGGAETVAEIHCIAREALAAHGVPGTEGQQ